VVYSFNIGIFFFEIKNNGLNVKCNSKYRFLNVVINVFSCGPVTDKVLLVKFLVLVFIIISWIHLYNI